MKIYDSEKDLLRSQKRQRRAMRGQKQGIIILRVFNLSIIGGSYYLAFGKCIADLFLLGTACSLVLFVLPVLLNKTIVGKVLMHKSPRLTYFMALLMVLIISLTSTFLFSALYCGELWVTNVG